MKKTAKKIIKKIIRKPDSSNKFKFKFDWELLDTCPLCSFEVLIPNGYIEWNGVKFLYNVCTKCGLKFMNPRPTEESYKKFYKEMFWQQKLRGRGWNRSRKDVRAKEEGIKALEVKAEKVREPRIIPAIEKYIKVNENSNILDIGCALGVTLNKLNKKHNCNVYAIEPSLEAREYIKDLGNIKLLGYYAEELEDISKKDLKFDAIIFSHILENTVDPFRVLKYAGESLAENGIIYIETPNLFTYEAMNPYHPFIFSKRIFELMAKEAGLSFKQISERTDPMLTSIFKKN